MHNYIIFAFCMSDKIKRNFFERLKNIFKYCKKTGSCRVAKRNNGNLVNYEVIWLILSIFEKKFRFRILLNLLV